jgi:hypothetical protein
MKIKVDDIVEVKDRQTIEIASKEAGRLVNGKSFKVTKVTSFRQDSSIFRLVELNTENFYLFIKESQDNWYAIGCFVPDDVRNILKDVGGTREEMMRAVPYVFKNPEGEYADQLNAGELVYKKIHDPIYGEVLGEQKMFGLAHLRCEQQTDNPEVIILEYGNLEIGGYVMFLQGVVLQDNELEIL